MAVKKPVKRTATKKTRVGKANATPKAKARSQAKPKAKAKPRAQAKKTPRSQAKAKTATAKNANNALRSLAIIPTGKPNSSNVKTQPNNPLLTQDQAEMILNAFNNIRRILEGVAANLRPLDRARLNSVKIKRQGFIERVFALASENTQFLPSYLTIAQFQQSYDYFIILRALLDACEQLKEYIANLVIEASDIIFTDAGEFYNSVKEAARRRVDGAESIYKELAPFYKTGKRMNKNGEPVETLKKEERDAKGY